MNAVETVTTGPVVADDVDETTCECGCWCGGCPCVEDEEWAADRVEPELRNSSHCCECGRSGTDCEYHCTCS
jgi:hypothetical protein